MKKTLSIVLITVVIYALSAGASFYFFSKQQKQVISQIPPVAKTANGTLAFDNSLPKTESCPLNGMLYSTQQKSWWQQHEPLGVMIENHQDSRPQSGLSYADVIYEAVAEGGITRFLAMFYCQDGPVIGPVRSARVYFIDWLSEYGMYPLYGHVGGANAGGEADALGELDSFGWTGYNDLNQFSIGYPTYVRDATRQGHPVATEHTVYSSTAQLWDVGKQRGITNVDKSGNLWDKEFVTYDFKDDAPSSQRPASQKIHLEFWTGDPAYYVDWIYDPATNLYKRNNGGVSHIDRDTNKQLTTKNIAVLFMQESHANDGYDNNVHLIYSNKGTGNAAVFMDGKQIKATWKKTSRTSRTLLYDGSGNPISFDRGTIWFSILPLTGVMNVQ